MRISAFTQEDLLGQAVKGNIKQVLPEGGSLGIFSTGDFKDAFEYPNVGVINDVRSKRYLLSPDYWNREGKPLRPGWPVSSLLPGVVSPPAVWWQEREKWKDAWDRLADGNVGSARHPMIGKERPPPEPPKPPPDAAKASQKNCITTPGLLKQDSQQMKEWWNWLEKGTPEGPAEIVGFGAKLKSAALGVAKAVGLDDLGSNQCPQPVELDDPASTFWEKPEEFDRSSPPDVEWEQEIWLRKNSNRRQTFPGFPRVLSPDGVRMLTPRLDRFEGSQAATLDPRLPHPARSPDYSMYAEEARKKMERKSTFKVYIGTPKGGLVTKLGSAAVDATIGGSKLEMLAVQRILKKDPDFIRRYASEGMVDHISHTGHPDTETRHLPPQRWEPLKDFPTFKKQYEGNWNRIWPTLGSELRLAGAASRSTVLRLGEQAQPKSSLPDLIAKAIDQSVDPASRKDAAHMFDSVAISGGGPTIMADCQANTISSMFSASRPGEALQSSVLLQRPDQKVFAVFFPPASL